MFGESHRGSRRDVQLGFKKKVRTRVIGLLKGEESVNRLCVYFGISRQAYYKSNSQMVKRALRTGLVVDMVQKVRRQMPRLGGKKLYHLLGSDLRQMGSIGRDKFFDILRDNDLLVVPKHSYTRTTQSYHRFYKWTNLVRDMQVTRCPWNTKALASVTGWASSTRGDYMIEIGRASCRERV